jgi:hypothetical protein
MAMREGASRRIARVDATCRRVGKNGAVELWRMVGEGWWGEVEFQDAPDCPRVLRHWRPHVKLWLKPIQALITRKPTVNPQ